MGALDFGDGAVYAALMFDGVERIDQSAPTAVINSSTSDPLLSSTVTFDASSSNLPFGTITDYRWDLDGSGTFATDTGTTPTVSTSTTS